MQRLRLTLLADAGRWDALTEAAQAYLAVHPENGAARAYLAEAQLRQQACEAAEATARSWRHVAPEDNDARRIWGALTLPESPTEAVTALCKSDAALCTALTACDDLATCDLPLGKALLRQGDLALAACVLSRAAADDPASGEAHAWLGSALDALGFTAKANMHLERATALSPASPLAWTLLGQHHLRRDNYMAAREALRTAHELDPTNPAPCLGMAAALAGESRYDEIKPWIEAALERAPSDPEIYKAAARFYLARTLAQSPYPRQIAEGAVALAPEDAEAQLLLGWSQLQAKMPEAALAVLDRALALDPELAQAHHLRGRALLALGRHDAAERAFVKAVDLGYRE
jgi:tetratricopeptide (TPR) repeat protein